MATEDATASVRKALAMGADRAVLISDEALVGADVTLTSEVLAAALKHIGYDLVIAGDQSTDGAGGVVPAVLAELLDIPQITKLTTIELDEKAVSGTRVIDRVTMQLRAELPAIVSVTERFPDARFPNFKGIMAAKKKPFEVLSVADLGADIDVLAKPRAIMTEISAKPPRAAGVKIVDEGDAGNQLAEFLKQNQLV
jgi:electron transfer flavoprotein beta subunit